MILSLDTPVRPATRRLWGLTLPELHDRFWAARGVQVVRQGDAAPLDPNAELYLLIEPQVLVVFKLRHVVERLSWLKPDLMYVRLNDDRDPGYRENLITDENDVFVRYERVYRKDRAHQTRVALTPNRDVASLWLKAETPTLARRALRRRVERRRSSASVLTGSVFHGEDAEEQADFFRELIQIWTDPSATIEGLRRIRPGVWADRDCRVDRNCRFVGHVWIGADRTVDDGSVIVGPAWLWDEPEAFSPARAVPFDEVEPHRVFADVRPPRRQPSSLNRVIKRTFDIALASAALLLTLPLWPWIMLAIYREDGRPFFFAHQRETMGGRSFPCLKFRSMRKDAEQIKLQLMEQNESDGPQFFLKHDPRLTRIGRFIRKTNLDELPQLLNVLVGQMSMVGPRPSPYKENQCCPAWRDARLSVRPGITGLWQVMRSRDPGLDFQEWIRYDVEYVERGNLGLDLWIIWKTIRILAKGFQRK